MHCVDLALGHLPQEAMGNKEEAAPHLPAPIPGKTQRSKREPGAENRGQVEVTTKG